MRLLVVCGSQPLISRRCGPVIRTAPQPPGPGLPAQAPSVKIVTRFIAACVPISPDPRDRPPAPRHRATVGVPHAAGAMIPGVEKGGGSAMAINERFMMYAAAFEQAFANDDWSNVGAFFTDDAVYETVGPPP